MDGCAALTAHGLTGLEWRGRSKCGGHGDETAAAGSGQRAAAVSEKQPLGETRQRQRQCSVSQRWISVSDQIRSQPASPVSPSSRAHIISTEPMYVCMYVCSFTRIQDQRCNAPQHTVQASQALSTLDLTDTAQKTPRRGQRQRQRRRRRWVGRNSNQVWPAGEGCANQRTGQARLGLVTRQDRTRGKNKEAEEQGKGDGAAQGTAGSRLKYPGARPAAALQQPRKKIKAAL
ncbi:hypothetical protein DM02DRAFT_220125 [Periconia macrospinosa]|uniref:Uncharacterized protein n=1 Tax=Periconia macrospinosa TaxID=97972 RepID=A0A2V1E119_9PLEO|nr:hypothetical protein DM02DRAFT_220125 [Periconia macrospinosa]